MLSTTTASKMFLALLYTTSSSGNSTSFPRLPEIRNCSKDKATPVCSPAQSGRYMRCLWFGCGLTQKAALFFNCIPVNYIATLLERGKRSFSTDVFGSFISSEVLLVDRVWVASQTKVYLGWVTCPSHSRRCLVTLVSRAGLSGYVSEEGWYKEASHRSWWYVLHLPPRASRPILPRPQ